MSTTRRGAGLLGLGSAVTGLLAYAVFAVTTRALGAEQAAPVSVLWTWWGFAGAALTFPVQHWVARTVSAHGEGSVAAALPRLAGIQVGVAAVAGGLAWLAREPLFGRDDAWFPLLVTVIALGSAAVGVVRGALTARERYAAVGASLVLENLVRLVGVAGLAVAGVDEPVAYGIALAAGHLVVLGWPSARRFANEGTTHRPGAFTFLVGAGAAQLTAQAVLTSGPVVVALSGGSPADVTALFAALALFRAPYLLGQSLVGPLTVRTTRFVVTGDTHRVHRLRLVVTGLALVGVPLAWVVGRWPGPTLLRWVFGADVELAGPVCGLVAAGCALAVVTLLLTVDALAHGRPGIMATAWGVGVAAGVVLFVALSALEPTERTAWAFVATEAVVLAVVAVRLPGTVTGRISRRA